MSLWVGCWCCCQQASNKSLLGSHRLGPKVTIDKMGKLYLFSSPLPLKCPGASWRWFIYTKERWSCSRDLARTLHLTLRGLWMEGERWWYLYYYYCGKLISSFGSGAGFGWHEFARTRTCLLGGTLTRPLGELLLKIDWTFGFNFFKRASLPKVVVAKFFLIRFLKLLLLIHFWHRNGDTFCRFDEDVDDDARTCFASWDWRGQIGNLIEREYSCTWMECSLSDWIHLSTLTHSLNTYLSMGYNKLIRRRI